MPFNVNIAFINIQRQNHLCMQFLLPTDLSHCTLIKTAEDDAMSSFHVSTETKERIVANLANFAYDPYNYTFLRQVTNIFLYREFSWL